VPYVWHDLVVYCHIIVDHIHAAFEFILPVR
jgi:hypothetical protein